LSASVAGQAPSNPAPIACAPVAAGVPSGAPSQSRSADPSAAVRILPPLEIADHAEALGWTEGSEVYALDIAGKVSYLVYPSGKGWCGHEWGVYDCATKARAKDHGFTLLPNRRVPVEGHTCGVCGKPVADCLCNGPEPRGKRGAVEGDPLDELTAEAQADGEYGKPEPATAQASPHEPSAPAKPHGDAGSCPKPETAWEAYLATGKATTATLTPGEIDAFNRFVADRERRAVEEADAERIRKLNDRSAAVVEPPFVLDVGVPSPRPAKSAGEVADIIVDQCRHGASLRDLIVAAIERERGSR